MNQVALLEALERIKETVGVGAPDVITANTLLGRVKQIADLAIKAIR